MNKAFLSIAIKVINLYKKDTARHNRERLDDKDMDDFIAWIYYQKDTNEDWDQIELFS